MPENTRSDARSDTRLSSELAMVLGVLVLTSFIMMLNETALSVALPSIMTEFSITAATAQWLLTGVMLTMAIMMPTTGWILDRFSTRAVFFGAVATFLIGSVGAALSPSFGIMLIGRVFQAVGTAIILPLQMTVVMTIVPPARRGTVMGIISVVMAVGPALGPTFAGAVMAVSTWHTTFWIMAVLVLVAGALGMWKLRNVGVLKKAPLDVLSVVLAAIAFGGLVYGLSSIGLLIDGGRPALITAGVASAGTIGLVLFVWRQIQLGAQDRALLNLQPLRIKNYVLALVVILSFQAALLGVANALPLYAQGALLVTPLVAGFLSLPGGLVETALSPVAGTLYDRIGPRPLIIPGTMIAAGALLWMGTVSAETPVWLIIVQYTVLAIGLALALTPLMTTALSSLPSTIYSHGSAIVNTLMQLAAAVGTAVMIAMYSYVAEQGGNTPEAQGEAGAAAFLFCGVVLVGACLVALFVRKPEEHGGGRAVETVEPA